MTMRLDRLRDDVRSALGLYLAESTLDDQAIDASLRFALDRAAPHLPLVTQVVTLVAAGPAQDISALIPAIAKVMELRYPYDPDFPTTATYRYETVAHGSVLFKYGYPSIGELLLVVGKPRYVLADLNGAADTLPAQFDTAIATIAAANLVRIEGRRRLVVDVPVPGAKATPIGNLPLLALTMEQEGIQLLYDLAPVSHNPAWGGDLLPC